MATTCLVQLCALWRDRKLGITFKRRCNDAVAAIPISVIDDVGITVKEALVSAICLALKTAFNTQFADMIMSKIMRKQPYTEEIAMM